MKRADATAAAEALGAEVKGSITKAVDLVVAGTKAGAKLKKAESLGLEIWSEGLFVHKLEEAEQRMAEEANETARQQLAKRKSKVKSRSRSRPRKSKDASKEDEPAWCAWDSQPKVGSGCRERRNENQIRKAYAIDRHLLEHKLFL